MFIPSTRDERIVDTVTFKLEKFAVPLPTNDDMFRASLEDLVAAVKSPAPGTIASTLPPRARDLIVEVGDVLSNASGTAAVDPP